MKRKYVWLSAAATTIVMFQNCTPQGVAFKTDNLANLASSTAVPATPSPSNGNDSSIAAEEFKVTFNSESAPLDMIWVIDNSGSMATEAALVQKNFTAFLTALNKSTNFRLLLISDVLANKNGVSIPGSFDPSNHKQINHHVESKDGPSILLDEVKNLGSTAPGFLRDNSKKMVVFVTDDNSQLAANTFMTGLESLGWNASDISVFGFVGADKTSSPCIDKPGTVYIDLAASTKGKSYNICAADWSGHFSDLINVSISKAIRRFTIGTSAHEISKVIVDGATLSSSSYSFDGDKILTLADSVSLKENSVVKISYKY